MAEKPVPTTPVVPPKKESKESTAVVDWKAQLAEMAVATAEAEKPSGNWVSFKSGVLTINQTPMKNNEVDCVVIQSIFENQLYKDRYDPNNPQPPICYALSETDDDLKPHPDSAEPQSTTCEVCPNNVWGSDPGGGKGKACKNVRRLAIISADDLSVEKLPQAEVALAKLPVTSVKNWSTYASQIANVLKLPPLAVISNMSVEPDAKTQFQVNFRLVDKIEDGALIQALLNKRKDTTSLIFAPYGKPTPEAATPAVQRKF
jgi:hypothetical protein